MKPQIKMIGLDLDGTLLTTKKKLLPYTRKILEQAISQGIIVLVATGRPLGGVPKELLDFPGMRYVLTANGARIIDQKQDRVLHELLIPHDTGNALLDVWEKYDTFREVYYNGKGYADKGVLSTLSRFLPDPYMAKYVISTREFIPDLRAFVNATAAPMDKSQALFAHMEEREYALNDLKLIKGIVASGALSNNIEVNAEGVNKGAGLLLLGNMLGIKKEEITACGDGGNDLAMLKAVGFSVAMKNGENDIRAAANYVTGTNDEEGAAKAIERFALRGGESC